MTFQPVPYAAQIVMEYSGNNGEPAVNVFHVGLDNDSDSVVHAAYSMADLQHLTDTFADWFDGAHRVWAPEHALKTFMCPQTALVRVTARDIQMEDGFEAETGVGVAGANSTEGLVPLPAGVTFAVSLRSGRAGKHRRGRFFMLGLSYQGSTDTGEMNTIKSDIAGDIAASTEELVAQLAGDGYAYDFGDVPLLVVVSRASKAANPTPPHLRVAGYCTVVTSAGFTDLNFDYQRRRAVAHNRGG